MIALIPPRLIRRRPPSPGLVRALGGLIHGSGLLAIVIRLPFVQIVLPLALWLLLGRLDPLLYDHGREATRFQFTWTGLATLSFLPAAIAVARGAAPPLDVGPGGAAGWAGIVGAVAATPSLWPFAAVFTGWLILSLWGAVSAAAGRVVRYPFTLRFF
ncbi:MAG: DUF4870 domain-containing protein [Hydrogenibacillus schlegelii]|uniref:DUF4870 domain-containing protein n=1 Tax=Hydrogenibacillus schlegelii TaxID=1484 RepID=A0A947CZF0_HYDSH|nr:DUF4870 domain-containing protein [Hydrogenibacillus schlegelii]